MISVTPSIPGYYQDAGAPAASYLSSLVPIELGQFYLDNSTGDLYICNNNSNQNALVWHKVPRSDQLAALQVQADWNQASSSNPSFINNKPNMTRNQSSASRSLNTGFQLSTTRDALINYSVDISCTISLVTGQTGTVFLEIASDSGFTTNLQELGRSVNGNTGTLTIGLNLTQNATGTLSGFVPAAYYCRLRTANTVGAPVFTYRSGQEILL
jgi:hypothetical protein